MFFIFGFYCKNCQPVIELQHKKYTKLPETAKTTATDLPILGTKHFALGVQNVEQAKEFVLQNSICQSVDIKMPKYYMFA